MTAGTRAEHLAWCKARALDYVDRGDYTNALASFASDIRKHPETADVADTLVGLFPIALLAITNNDVAGVRRFIDGFQ